MTDFRSPEAETILARFDNLDAAVIDTSSIIQAQKAGFLPALAAGLKLFSIEEVRGEFFAGGEPSPLPPEICFLQDTEGKTTDGKIVAAALASGLPIISEDRKILLYADKSGLDYYNVLMMLEFLLFKGAVDLETHGKCRERLFENSRYSPWVKSYAEKLHWEIRKRL